MPEKTKIEEIESKLDKVLFYLHNDTRTGKKGLVQDVTDMKEDMLTLKASVVAFMSKQKTKEEVDKAVTKRTIIMASTIVSAIVTVIGGAIKLLFFK